MAVLRDATTQADQRFHNQTKSPPRGRDGLEPIDAELG
jgi:hypothetical protein